MNKQILILTCLILMICTASLSTKKWHEDIDYLKKELPKKHKNAYHTLSEKQFQNGIKTLLKKAKTRSDNEMTIELTRFIASIGDAHTSVLVGDLLKSVPIGLKLFDDGLFVISIDSSHQIFLKQKVVSINQVPVDTVYKTFAALISHENNYWLKELLPSIMKCPEIFHYFGYSNSKDSLCFQFENGQELTLGIPEKPIKIEKVVSAEKLVLSRAPNKYYWMRESDKYIYIQYNKCRNESLMTFEQFTANVMTAFNDSTEKVIIDLRLNTGGSSNIINPLVKQLIERNKIKPFKTFALIGPMTFSSGTFAAIDLQHKLGAILVGEPTGGSPYSYGNNKPLTLPNSKISIGCSTDFYNINNTKLNTIYPDVEIKTNSSSYFRGVDAVMSYAISN